MSPALQLGIDTLFSSTVAARFYYPRSSLCTPAQRPTLLFQTSSSSQLPLPPAHLLDHRAQEAAADAEE